MNDIFYCKGSKLADYLIKNGSEFIESIFENGKIVYVFKYDESIDKNIEKWELDKRKWLF